MCRPRACSSRSTRLAMVDLPEPDRPVNQSIAGFWPFSAARAGLLDRGRLPMDVGGAAQRRSAIMPAPHGRVGVAVDQDEGAGVAVLRVGIEGDRLRGREIAEADLVQRQRARRHAAPACSRRSCAG